MCFAEPNPTYVFVCVAFLHMMVSHVFEPAALAHQGSPPASVTVTNFLAGVIALHPAPAWSAVEHGLTIATIPHNTHQYPTIPRNNHHTPWVQTQELIWKRTIHALCDCVGSIDGPHSLGDQWRWRSRLGISGNGKEKHTPPKSNWFPKKYGHIHTKDSISIVQFAPVPKPSSPKYKKTPNPWTMQPVNVMDVPHMCLE